MGSKERRQREKDARRKQIQEAASTLILSNGYHATKIEDICDVVELTPGALYRHFKNKDELFASLLIEALELAYGKHKEVAETPDLTAKEKILRFKDAFYEAYEQRPLMIRCMIQMQLEKTMSSIGPEVAEQITNNNRKITELMLAVFAEGIASGEFVPAKPVLYLDMCWSLFIGLVLWEEAKKEVNPKADFLKSTLDHNFDIFLAGIAKT